MPAHLRRALPREKGQRRTEAADGSAEASRPSCWSDDGNARNCESKLLCMLARVGMAATYCTANCAPRVMCSLERARVSGGLLARSVRLELSRGAMRAFISRLREPKAEFRGSTRNANALTRSARRACTTHPRRAIHKSYAQAAAHRSYHEQVSLIRCGSGLLVLPCAMPCH